MSEFRYRLRYLPLFYEDLSEKVTYIQDRLKNPQAALDLLDAVEAAIQERVPVAEAFEPFYSVNERKYPYYRIYVKNFVIWYVVIDEEGPEKIMEVRRFLYHRQNKNRKI